VPNAKLFSVMQALSFSQSGGQILPEGKKIFVLGEAQWDCRRFICRRAGMSQNPGGGGLWYVINQYCLIRQAVVLKRKLRNE
jgi:hypothetical protein